MFTGAKALDLKHEREPKDLHLRLLHRGIAVSPDLTRDREVSVDDNQIQDFEFSSGVRVERNQAAYGGVRR